MVKSNQKVYLDYASSVLPNAGSVHELGVKTKNRLAASPDEVKSSRFSPRLIRSLRKRLGITQRELAALTGVTIGAAHLWETGKFLPSDEKRGVIVALRKLRRREVRELLNQKRAGKART